EFIDLILETVFNRLEVEFDLTVTVRYMDTLSYFINHMGAPAIHRHIETIIKVLVEALEEKTIAQIEAIEEEDNEEVAQDQFLFMKEACQVISDLAQQYKQRFMPYFSHILKGLLSLINTKNPEKDDWKII